MSELQTQLREYGLQLDRQAVPLEDLTPAGPPLSPTRVGWRGPLLAVGTAAAIIVAAVAAALLLGGLDPVDPVAPGVESTLPAFDMRSDTFCEWFTPEDMNEIIATAQLKAGTEFVFEEFTSNHMPECPFQLDDDPPVHYWSSADWGTTDWDIPGWGGPSPKNPELLSPNIYLTLWDGYDDGAIPHFDPDAFQRHQLLDDEVSYQVRNYQLLWHEGVSIYLKVDQQGEAIYDFGFSADDHEAVQEMTSEYEELGLAVANQLLQRMNWIDPDN